MIWREDDWRWLGLLFLWQFLFGTFLGYKVGHAVGLGEGRAEVRPCDKRD